MKDEFKRISNRQFPVGGPSRKEKDFYRRVTRRILKEQDKKENEQTLHSKQD